MREKAIRINQEVNCFFFLIFFFVGKFFFCKKGCDHKINKKKQESNERMTLISYSHIPCEEYANPRKPVNIYIFTVREAYCAGKSKINQVINETA